MIKYIEIAIVVIFLSLSIRAVADDNSFLAGQKLFRKNCASCHNVHKELIGPMLGSITKKKSNEWLITFIKNSQDVILSNDEYANFLYEQYNRTVMPSFNHLSEGEINNILQYIESESKVGQPYATTEDLNEMEGKNLFRNHCSTCHQINSEAYGPSLGSVYRRRPKDWLVKFITNSQSVIKSNDAYAENLFQNFDKKVMPPFYFLDSNSIINIAEYIDAASKSEHHIAGVNGNPTTNKSKKHLTTSSQNIGQSKPIHNLFGIIVLYTISAIIGCIFFVVIKMLYINLNK